MIKMSNSVDMFSLSHSGVCYFSEYLQETRQIEASGGKPQPPPREILFDLGYAEPLKESLQVGCLWPT